jgi:hypothetical protein
MRKAPASRVYGKRHWSSLMELARIGATPRPHLARALHLACTAI